MSETIETPPEESPESEEEKQRRLTKRSKFLGGIIAFMVKCIATTLRFHKENPSGVKPLPGGSILVTWHGRSLIPAWLLRDKGCWALISLSKDGEMQNNIFQRFGFQTVRGSTGRGGVRGALQMARKVKEGGMLAFTPDGPRGPSHKVQLGVILMAEKSGAPIIPIGCSANRRWIFNKSWDRYMVPQPFAKAFYLVGKPIFVPNGLNETSRKAYALEVEFAINRLEKRAEELAGYPTYEWDVLANEPLASDSF